MNIVPDVNALMAGGLSEWLAGQQAARDEAKAKSFQRTMIGVGAGAVIGLFLLIVSGRFTWVAIGFGIPFALGSAWAAAARKPVIDAIKTQINAKVAETLGLRFSIAGEPGPEFERSCVYGLLPSYDRSVIEDFWSGEIPTGSFTLYEGHLEEQRGSGKNRHWATVFRGAIVTLRFARPFLGVTLVERDNARLKFFGLRTSIEVEGKKLERVKMVDPRFEDVFEIWSNDAVEARYLVHPAYVERLIDVEKRFQGDNVRALFHGGDLTIVVETEELFESGSLDADQDRERMARTIDQFMGLFTLAKEMNERPRT